MPVDVDGPGPSYMDGSAMTVQSELLLSHKSEQSKLDSLKEMFPDIDGQQIQAALTEAQCDVGRAVNKLLAAAGAGMLCLLHFSKTWYTCTGLKSTVAK